MSIPGTMMSVPLTLDWILQRAASHHGHVEVVSRRPDRSLERSNYATVASRARRLAQALVGAGIQKGDRVATLMWNHATHLEAYFAIPLAGAVVHTLNLRLHPDEISYIAADAGDRILIVDDVLLPLLGKLTTTFERVIVAGNTPEGHHSYEDFLADAPNVELPRLSEEDALGMCYTSGTTGKPKGVVYTHRSTILHALVTCLPDALALSRGDRLLPVVPMFHVNAWGLPYACAMIGAAQIHPGPCLDPQSLLELMAMERVNIAAGVPTIWIGIREALDKNPGAWTLVPGLRMIVGGSAAPESLIRDFDRLGLRLLHAWGMTETSPIGLVSRLPPELDAAPEDVQYKLRAKQGVPPPLVDVRVVNDAGVVPRDGKTTGEVQVRGPWVASRYATLQAPDRWVHEGGVDWFRTGDVAHVDEHGFVQLVDRVADLIKSGGEWIASQELENALMGHPAVKEAAVIGVAHPKWSERPLAIVVVKPDVTIEADELRAFLAARFPKFWLPDAFEFVGAIPRTSAGKFKKTELRDTYRDWQW
jgi:fatty-acyl-CoA synthase